jgi:hypothetical protein
LLSKLEVHEFCGPRGTTVHIPESVTVANDGIYKITKSYEPMISDYLNRFDVRVAANSRNRRCAKFNVRNLLDTRLESCSI